MQSYECPPKPTWTTHDSMDNFPLPPVQHLQPQVSESGAWRDAAPPAAAADAPSPAAQPSAPGGDPPAVEAPAAAGSGLPQPEGSAAPLACGISPLERLASSESETRLGWIQTGRPKEAGADSGGGLGAPAGSRQLKRWANRSCSRGCTSRTGCS